MSVYIMTALGAAAPSRLEVFNLTGSIGIGSDDAWPLWLGEAANRSAWTKAVAQLPESIVQLELGLGFNEEDTDQSDEEVRARIDWLTLSAAAARQRIGDGTWPRLKSFGMHYDWPRRALMHGYSHSICSALRSLARSMRELEESCASHGVGVFEREPRRRRSPS